MFLTESERLQTIKACRDCPMCHPVDMFAHVTGKEANTPRGRGMTLWGLEKGLLSWESEGVSGIFYQAFLDGLPQEWCEGNYDFDEMVIDARKTLVEKGLAPAVGFRNCAADPGNRESSRDQGERSLRDRRQILCARTRNCHLPRIGRPHAPPTNRQGPDQDPYPTGNRIRSSGGRSRFRILILSAGGLSGGAAQAKKITALLQSIRAKKLVVLSASAYRMFTTRYARFGAPLPEGLKVLHATEFLGDLLAQGKLVLRKKLKKPITYHDPCCLARFTYLLEPPRNILAALSESPIVEMNWSGKQARSCGGCGGVPFTYPEISEKASQVRIEEALKTGAQILASADPECEEMLGRVAKEIEVRDIVELVAEAI